MSAPSFDHAATVGQDLYAANLEHGAVLAVVRGGRASALGHDHAKAGMGRLETASEHEVVPGLEEMEHCRHTWERELADEDGGVESCVAFFVFDCLTAFVIEGRERFEDDGSDCFVGRMIVNGG
jgi:hypothetical protein